MSEAEGRPSLADARRARRMTPEIAEEYAAARLRFELGEAVRKRRLELHLSQSALGTRAGLTQSAVARFEAGGTVPTIPVLERLARALELELRVQFVPYAASA
ncbi:helix-turn-helix domain-containing protein [Streptomyces sp. HPF1205]|uniref:helix-turn-helix domain-containing protein n=1 Tax=Streptomyces sp. HPF1205 TaxID=2873262 RepID=UPI001CEDD1F0|nr:helix-turn-helix transcriptional regulator [Streptomyces sp. HPF1205]